MVGSPTTHIRVKAEMTREAHTRVHADELYSATLYRCGVPSRAIGICFVPVLHGNRTIVSRVRIHEYTGSAEFVCTFDLQETDVNFLDANV